MRCEFAETRMRSNLVVLAPELFDEYLGINTVLEPVKRQTLVSELAVE